MTITLGPHTFMHASYDAFGDVLYLRRRAGEGGVGDGDTPEGHAWIYPVDGGDEVVGADIANARRILDRHGRLVITLPDGSPAEVPQARELLRR